MILSDALLVEKAKLLANGLGIPQGTLKFSNDWLEKFKDRNGIHQYHLEEEAEFANRMAINNTLPFHKLDGLILQYTDVTFLPPNVTSKIQPLDANDMGSELDDLANALEALHPYLTYPMQVDEFLSISDKDIVYEVSNNNQVITDIVNTFRTADLAAKDLEEIESDDSNEIPIIDTNIELTSLKTVCMFLLQQDNDTNEYIKAVRKICSQ
ncbi:12097_t:CDS:2 [Cetraspora pellucida]|uniref:12097_t:CDS:1 n=1 Tax=Cetraspora pellucida TaxID=1433469 RepID=A0A9N9ICM2_9GLOM|nr:12097_t:CDS:2 [Cetraspora pellucida]